MGEHDPAMVPARLGGRHGRRARGAVPREVLRLPGRGAEVRLFREGGLLGLRPRRGRDRRGALALPQDGRGEVARLRGEGRLLYGRLDDLLPRRRRSGRQRPRTRRLPLPHRQLHAGTQVARAEVAHGRHRGRPHGLRRRVRSAGVGDAQMRPPRRHGQRLRAADGPQRGGRNRALRDRRARQLQPLRARRARRPRGRGRPRGRRVQRAARDGRAGREGHPLLSHAQPAALRRQGADVREQRHGPRGHGRELSRSPFRLRLLPRERTLRRAALRAVHVDEEGGRPRRRRARAVPRDHRDRRREGHAARGDGLPVFRQGDAPRRRGRREVPALRPHSALGEAAGRRHVPPHRAGLEGGRRRRARLPDGGRGLALGPGRRVRPPRPAALFPEDGRRLDARREVQGPLREALDRGRRHAAVPALGNPLEDALELRARTRCRRPPGRS